jgi:PAS domain S-box-containing protein
MSQAKHEQAARSTAARPMGTTGTRRRREVVYLRGLQMVAIGGVFMTAGDAAVGPAALTLLLLLGLSNLALLALPRRWLGGPTVDLVVGAVDVLALVAAVHLAGTTGMLLVSCLMLLAIVALAANPVHASAGTAAVCAMHVWLVLRDPAGHPTEVAPQLLLLASTGLYFGYLSSSVHLHRRRADAALRQRAEMECLVEILGVANSSLDTKTVASAIVQETSRTLPLTRCSVLFVDENVGRGYVIASHDDPSIDRLEIDLAKYPEIRAAIHTREPVLVRDVATDPLTHEVRGILAGLDLKSILVVPLVYEQDLLGTICMRTSRTGHEFTEAELRFCEAVGRACANGIKNALLHQQLREESARYRRLAEKLSRIFDDSPEPILGTDNEGRITEFNPAAERLLGHTRQEVLGWPCSSLFVDDEGKWLMGQIGGHGPGGARLCHLRRKDGRLVDVELSMAPLRDETGGVIGAVWLGRDLTELHATLTQLLQTKRLSTMGEVVSGVAHELNNPLSGVLGFTELLLQRALEPGAREEVTLIQDAARRCQRIVSNLLDFTREGKTDRRERSLNEIVEETLDIKKYQLHVNGIEVARELDPHLPRTMVDSHQFRQVLLNLIQNAQQAMTRARRAEPSRLIVRSTFADGLIRIEIEDNGEGMSEATRHRCFERFFTTRQTGGAGLGLTICKTIVEEHGGHIYAASRVGQGSTFTLELPVQTAEGVVAPEVAARPVAPPVRTGSRILVVDDEPIVLQLFVNLLEGRGYKIDTAVNGREACSKVDGKSYDLVITDVRMPEMNGVELYPKLLERRPDLRGRVIFISGDVHDREIARFLSDTGVPLVSKPVEVREIVRIVDETLAVQQGAARKGI